MTSTIGGFKDRLIESVSKVEPVTEQYLGKHRTGLDVFAQCVYFQKATDAVEAGSTTNSIVATVHVAAVGDIIRFTSGVNAEDFCFVQSVTTNLITLSQRLTTAPSAADTFEILRPTVFRVDSSGNLLVSATLSGTSNVNIAQYGGVATSLGQKTMAASEPVTIASDQPAISVSPGDVSYTDTLTSLNDTVGTTVEVKHGATISIRVYGTFSQTIAFEWSPDNSNWQAWTALSKISREVVGASYSYLLLNDTGALSGTSRYVYETWIPSGYLRCKTTSFTSGTANIGLYLDLNTTDPFTFLAYTGKINEAYRPQAAIQLGAQTTSDDIFAPVPQNDTYGLHTYSYIRGGALANTQAGFYGFGNLTAAGQSVTADLDVSGLGFSSLTVEITGTFTGATLIFERKGYDSSGNFYATKGFDDVNNVLTDTLTTISTGNRSLVFDCDSCTSFRVRCTALASGTVTIYIMSSSSGGELKRVVAVGTTAISAASLPLPTGAATSALQSSVQEFDGVTGQYYNRCGGYDLDAGTWFPIPTAGFGTYVPVSVNAGIYGAGIGNTGSITGAAQTVILNTLNGYNEGVITVNGTYSATFAFEALKNATWYSIPVWRADGGTAAETSSGALVNVSRAWRFNVAGFDSVRLRCSTYVSGTANIEIQMTSFGAHTSQTLLPTGQTTMANSQSVSIASDQTAISVTDSTTGLGDGRKTVTAAATAEALASSTSCKWVEITAETDNTGLVVYGASTVVAALSTRRGTPLYAGDCSGRIPIDNLADVYLDVTVSGDGVTYTYGTQF